MPKSSDELRLASISGGIVTCLPGEAWGPRPICEFELVFMIHGQAICQLGKRRLPLSAGSVLLLRPGVSGTYAWETLQLTRHAFLRFRPLSLPSDWPEPAAWPLARASLSVDVVQPQLRYVLRRWLRGDVILRHPPRSLCRMLEAALEAFLHDADQSPSAPLPQFPDAVCRALDWTAAMIAKRPDHPIHLTELARAALVSDKHLIRLFHDCLRISPMHAVRRMRLSRSMMLLARSDLTVQQVANHCGFASAFHFSRLFTELYGAPPRILRLRLRAGSSPPLGPLAPRIEPEACW